MHALRSSVLPYRHATRLQAAPAHGSAKCGPSLGIEVALTTRGNGSLHRYNPIKTIKTSFIGTMNMLGLAKRCRARFLISSTSEVYGDPLQHPQVRGSACPGCQCVLSLKAYGCSTPRCVGGS